jgi:cellulose synthase/poly-beta-1,6-N-acetylglucosamine synthase-like glycosyltransferase
MRSLHRLRNVPAQKDLSVSISVVVAARDEAATVEHALQSLLAQDYPNFEVIVANDRSTDATGAILERIRAQHPQLKVVTISELPPNWLGKNHALHMAAQQATGDYILFTDADVVMQPSTLARALSFCEQHDVEHIAVFPDLPAPNYWTGAFFALFGLGFLMLTQPWFVRNGRTPLPAGIGAFNMVRRSAYLAIGGHTTFALRPEDDVALAVRLRTNGARQQVLLGEGQILVEWYATLPAAIRGLEKNAFAPFEYSLPLLLVAIGWHFLAYVVPWVGLFGPPSIRALCVVAIIAQIVSLGATGTAVMKSWRYAPVMPIAALIFEFTVLRAAFVTLRQGGIRWRDTFYPLELLRTNKLRG